MGRRRRHGGKLNAQELGPSAPGPVRGLYFAEGQAVGVECELHISRLERYQGAVADADPAWNAGVW